MKKEIILSVKNNKFKGNLLDVGSLNYGIIYNIYKSNNSDFEVEYIDSEETEKLIKKDFYDVCTVFLGFSTIMLKRNREELFKEIDLYLKEDGYIYLWDIDKGIGTVLDDKVKVIMDDNKVKEFTLKDYNILKDSSEKSIFNLMNTYFDIIYARRFNKAYFIKARKRRRKKDEINISRD